MEEENQEVGIWEEIFYDKIIYYKCSTSKIYLLMHFYIFILFKS